jgi:hypothetical protein
MMKRKYNVELQDFSCLTMLIKSYDTDIKDKDTIFDDTEIKSFMLGNMESGYWWVRQESGLGLPFSEKKIIPRNTEQTEILIHSVGIPTVFRNEKRSEFRSEPYRGR